MNTIQKIRLIFLPHLDYHADRGYFLRQVDKNSGFILRITQ